MSGADWIDDLATTTAEDASIQRLVDLHLADTAIAFFASCGSPESRAIARFYAGSGCGPSGLAAAASAIIRRSECDDIDLVACVTPGGLVMPVALAASAAFGSTVEQVDRAIAAGYRVGTRLGAALGGADAFASGVWPTLFAAPLIAAVTAGMCLGFDGAKLSDALGIAAAGMSGRVGRPPGSPSSRWLCLGEAVAKGFRAAVAASQGFRGDRHLVTAEGLAELAGGPSIDRAALRGTRGLRNVGVKPFTAARQTLNAIIGFRSLIETVAPDNIEKVEIAVAPLHWGMVSRAADPHDRLGAISNLAVQIALAALRPDSLFDCERQGWNTPEILAFAERVTVIADPDLSRYLPEIWAARIAVTAGGKRVEQLSTHVAGDAGDAALDAIIEHKAARMVPERYRALCLAPLYPSDNDTRGRQRAALWQAMQTVVTAAPKAP